MSSTAKFATVQAPSSTSDTTLAVKDSSSSSTSSGSRVAKALVILLVLVGVCVMVWLFVRKPTQSPSTLPPSSGPPSSNAPSSGPPSSNAPSSGPPSSNAPSSGPPSSNAPSSGPQIGNYGTSSDFPGLPGVSVQAGPGAFSSTLVSSLNESFTGNAITTAKGEYLLTPDGLYALWVTGSTYAGGPPTTNLPTDLQTYFGQPVIVQVDTKTIVTPPQTFASYPIANYYSYPPDQLLLNNDGSMIELASDGSPAWTTSPFCPSGRQCIPPFTASLDYDANGIPLFQVIDSNNVQVFQLSGQAPS